MFQASQPHKNARNVTELSPTLESAIHKLAHVGRESKAQKIQIIKLAPGMPQTNHIARALPSSAMDLNDAVSIRGSCSLKATLSGYESSSISLANFTIPKDQKLTPLVLKQQSGSH